ncbi:hypothetical protein BCR42DRAFT_201387 [Absidia repens]|uniref:RRM domain-containing protein n=1 Tax=Absidia repens TaxID=90262 RepID=A0A1X2HR72_9FUNG|nr:hypothetical protein BCR42DRAFT_201387 [Absidia repens]
MADEQVTQDTSSVPVEKRIFVGGLPTSVTPDQLQDRFAKFGSVSKVAIALDDQGQCRGFAHFTIDTTPKKWTSCLSVYNGSRWKGEKMRLEESKPDYIELKRQKEEKLALKAEKKRKREVRWNNSDGFFAKDMSLITDNNVNTRSGKWKRGRYGRAIAVMRLRKNDGTRFVYDPMNYKNNLEKLYNINVRMKHPRELPMSYEEYEDEEPDQDAVFHQQQQQQQHSHIPSADIDDDNDSDDLEPAMLSSPINAQTKDKGEEKRLAAIERRSLEQQAKKDLMKQNEKERKHISFDDDEKKEPQTEDELKETQETEPQQPKDGAKWMFDSDSEDDDLDIRINPVMEGEKGKERLELQSRYQGDDRFKLDEAFIDDDEDEMTRPTQATQMDDEISKDLGAEKNQAMDVLRSMFGDIKVMTQTKPDTQWSSGARFDPDADDASNYLVQPAKTEKEDEDMGDASSTQDDDDDDEVALANKRPESAMPEVSSDKHFSVNVNLKPLFGAEEEPFKLFGGGDDDENDTPGAIFGGDKSYENVPSSFIPKTTESQVGLGLMFFLHSDNPSLVKSCYSYDPNGIFQRNEAESETYEANWRTGRTIVSDILKNRERNALRKHRKQTGRDLK